MDTKKLVELIEQLEMALSEMRAMMPEGSATSSEEEEDEVMEGTAKAEDEVMEGTAKAEDEESEPTMKMGKALMIKGMKEIG